MVCSYWYTHVEYTSAFGARTPTHGQFDAARAERDTVKCAIQADSTKRKIAYRRESVRVKYYWFRKS